MNDRESDLEKFRNEWRQEVQKKPPGDKKVKEQWQQPAAASSSVLDVTEKIETLSVENKPVTAMDHYLLAVENEREGKLGQALDSYRRAFKLDPEIDFAYKKHYQTHILPTLHEPVQEEKRFKHIIPLGKEYEPPIVSQEPLSDLVERFLDENITSIPTPEGDSKPAPLAKLPGEVMLHILRHLLLHYPSSIGPFALTCKRFFLYSQESSIWQHACVDVFRTPGTSRETSREHQSKRVLKYNSWRQMYIDRPRVRYDGIYISTCHYIRQGESESSWNKPIHLITYYRYLRFFPDGTLLKHVTTEEPAQVVRLLKPGFCTRQVFFGRFSIEDNVAIEMKDPTLPTEIFYMTLGLKQTQRGKHNKLVWEEYLSVPLVPDRAHHQHDLKLLKPYFFSHVRSYKVDYYSL
ncbi:hypothetical protein BY458DRAFT_512851 [Sporodiniella umbellata]|nr:hypothetical protein BY458DRAFT_512851 [Sporodiniella umbellata]